MPGTPFSDRDIHRPFPPGTHQPVTDTRVKKQMTCIGTRALIGIQKIGSPVPGSVAP